MGEWSNEWRMDFQPIEMQGLKNEQGTADLHDIFNPYTPRQHRLEVHEVYSEKDLGLTVDADLILMNLYQIRLLTQTGSQEVRRSVTTFIPGFKDLTWWKDRETYITNLEV